MKRVALTYFLVLFLLQACKFGGSDNAPSAAWEMRPPKGVVCDTVSIDTMDLKNPFITYDRTTDSYCMTADGGLVWVSDDLRTWRGPYDVLRYDTASWLGSSPVITSPEIHEFKGRYYFMATFEVKEGGVTKRSCSTLVADSLHGPYRTIDAKSHLLDKAETAAHPTFCKDYLGAGFMAYSRQSEKSSDAAVQIVMYSDDLGRRLGEAYEMMIASDVPWSHTVREGGKEPSPVLESPCLFDCGEESMGMLFTACNGAEKAVGVAYSETGTLNGPWIAEEKPLLEGVSGAAMFNDYDGTLVMVVSKDTLIGGVERSVPQLIKCDSQFEKLQIKGHYKF